jgi:deoxyribodipyrimidine photo-lyase
VGVGRHNVQVVWFKRDLRVHDHAPLCAAAAAGPVVPLYVVEPDVVLTSDDHADRHLAVVADALADLRASLTARGAALVVRTGRVVDVLDWLHHDLGVAGLWSHEETGNLATYARDRQVARWARDAGVTWTQTPQPGVIRRLQDRDTWTRQRLDRLAAPVLPAPEVLRGTAVDPGPLPVAPACADMVWRQEVTETAGRQRMHEFIRTGVTGYEHALSSPITAEHGCSRLSTHLAVGTVSAHEVIRRVEAERGRADARRRASLEAFGERLAWRDHFMQKLEDEPDLERRSYIAEFDELRADPDEALLERWTTGRTGFPFVDACLRSLAATGWLNFRARAMVVTVAAHDLWLPWQSFGPQLARWFSDYEPGIHWPQVQMQSATTGTNTIRVYDPWKQGRDHDPTGEFTRTWCPELAHLDVSDLHSPDIAVRRPTGYPAPAVDHYRAAAAAVARIEAVRDTLGPERRAVLERHGSRRPPPERRQRVRDPRRRRGNQR